MTSRAYCGVFNRTVVFGMTDHTGLDLMLHFLRGGPENMIFRFVGIKSQCLTF